MRAGMRCAKGKLQVESPQRKSCGLLRPREMDYGGMPASFKLKSSLNIPTALVHAGGPAMLKAIPAIGARRLPKACLQTPATPQVGGVFFLKHLGIEALGNLRVAAVHPLLSLKPENRIRIT
jgi:hypothetical protein